MERLKGCPAKGKKSNNCGFVGHFGRVCRKQQKPQNSQKQPPQRVDWVGKELDNNDEQEDEEQYVLGIDVGGSSPFMMKCRINRKTVLGND